MSAPTDYFVSVVSGSDAGGSGTIGDPWKTVQFALDNITQDATDGDVVNIQDGGLHTLSAALDLSTYGTPSGTAPLTFRGYTMTVSDGGRGDLNGGGSIAVLSSAPNGVSFIDMACWDTGANEILTLGQECRLVNCKIYNSTAGAMTISNNAFIYHCLFQNVSNAGGGGSGINFTNGILSHCYLENGTNKPDFWVLTGINTIVEHCVFDIDSATEGVRMVDGVIVVNCSFDGGGGTGKGVHTSADRDGLVVLNSIFANFSGAGAVGVSFRAGDNITIYTNNAFFNNTTDSANATGQHLGSDNESLASDPFNDAANDDYTTNDVGNVFGGTLVTSFLDKTLSITALDKGAVQRAGIISGGGGSGSGLGKYKYRGLTHSSGLGAS